MSGSKDRKIRLASWIGGERGFDPKKAPGEQRIQMLFFGKQPGEQVSRGEVEAALKHKVKRGRKPRDERSATPVYNNRVSRALGDLARDGWQIRSVSVPFRTKPGPNVIGYVVLKTPNSK